VRLTTKSHAASPAVTGSYVQVALVYETGHVLNAKPANRCAAAADHNSATRRDLGGSGFGGDYLYQLSAVPSTETNNTVGGSEQRVITATPHIVAGMNLGAALTHNDRARKHPPTVKDFHTEALSVGVATVSSGAAAFGFGHDKSTFL